MMDHILIICSALNDKSHVLIILFLLCIMSTRDEYQIDMFNENYSRFIKSYNHQKALRIHLSPNTLYTILKITRYCLYKKVK